MDPAFQQEDDELKTRRDRLNKIIEQGSKVEFLFSQDEFQFFLGWVKATRDELAATILNGKLLDGMDLRKEDFNKGGYHYLDKVIEAAEAFASKAKKARHQLKKLDEELHDAR